MMKMKKMMIRAIVAVLMLLLLAGYGREATCLIINYSEGGCKGWEK
jgi:hypothetical protein